MAEKFIITREFRDGLMGYLGTKPWAEVNQAQVLLSQLQPYVEPAPAAPAETPPGAPGLTE